MIVPDASLLLEVLLRTPAGVGLESRLFGTRESLHAPHLIDLECAQVIRRLCAGGALSDRRARQALQDLDDLPLVRYPHQPFMPRIWALKDNLSAYDAAYVTLAEVLEAPLLTRDARLARAPGHGAVVELLDEVR